MKFLHNADKTKEVTINFSRKKKIMFHLSPSKGRLYSLTNTLVLSWTISRIGRRIQTLFRKAQSRLFHLRKLGSFEISRTLLHVFHQGILASVQFYVVLCCGEREE